MRRALATTVVLLTLMGVLCIIASIWLPEHRWQWMATGAIAFICAGVTANIIDPPKKPSANHADAGTIVADVTVINRYTGEDKT